MIASRKIFFWGVSGVKKNGIIFINPTKKLTDYVNNLDESFTMEMLPYLEIDGHPSHIGYNLISDLIISNLKKN